MGGRGHSNKWLQQTAAGLGCRHCGPRSFVFCKERQKSLEFYILVQVLKTNKIKQTNKGTVWGGCTDLTPSASGDLGSDSLDPCLPAQRPLSQEVAPQLSTLVPASLLKPLPATSWNPWPGLQNTVNGHSSINTDLIMYLYKVISVCKTHHRTQE